MAWGYPEYSCWAPNRSAREFGRHLYLRPGMNQVLNSLNAAPFKSKDGSTMQDLCNIELNTSESCKFHQFNFLFLKLRIVSSWNHHKSPVPVPFVWGWDHATAETKFVPTLQHRRGVRPLPWSARRRSERLGLPIWDGNNIEMAWKWEKRLEIEDSIYDVPITLLRKFAKKPRHWGPHLISLLPLDVLTISSWLAWLEIRNLGECCAGLSSGQRTISILFPSILFPSDSYWFIPILHAFTLLHLLTCNFTSFKTFERLKNNMTSSNAFEGLTKNIRKTLSQAKPKHDPISSC